MILTDFYEQQASMIAATVKDTTWRGYKCAWNHRLLPSLGHLPLDMITAFIIEEAYASWTGSHSTKADALALLGRILKRAVRAGLISANPMADVELPRSPDFNPAARALTDEQFRRLLRRIPEPAYRDPMIVLHGAGLRWSEMAALDPAMIDFTNRRAIISQSLTPNGTGVRTMSTTKSGHARTVPLSVPVVDALNRGIHRARSLGIQDRALVGPLGGILDGFNVARALDFHSWRDQIKRFPALEPSLRFHDLRHTAAVNFFRAGVDAPTVKDILGHSSLQVTQIYARGADTAVDSARVKLDKLNAVGIPLEVAPDESIFD